MAKLLITGGTGFVGTPLLKCLKAITNHHITAVVRRNSFKSNDPRIEFKFIHDIISGSWKTLLTDTDVVIHAAAKAHVTQDILVNPFDEFRAVNTEATLNLAHQAARAGVKRFIFLSSIKAVGESSTLGHPFTLQTPCNPQDPYGISKCEAERGLRKISEETGLEVVIICPPLVYGPGVKANFLQMMNWLYKGIPLPLGAINNKRSLIYVDNLVDLIVACIDYPDAANQTFFASDDNDLSTTQLLQQLGCALGKPARLIPVPEKFLKQSLTLLGKKSLTQKLCGSLQIDITKTKHMLDWYPPISVDEGLRRTAQRYLHEKTH